MSSEDLHDLSWDLRPRVCVPVPSNLLSHLVLRTDTELAVASAKDPSTHPSILLVFQMRQLSDTVSC